MWYGSFAGFPSVFAVMKGDLVYENIPHTHPGDTVLLLQAKREGNGALPFQTALQKGKYATAILLLKGIELQE